MSKAFWKQVEKNVKEVEKWAKWKKNYTINAETISTGKFLKR